MARIIGGIGMVVVVAAADVALVTEALQEAGETVFTIGAIDAGLRGCTVAGPADGWHAMEPWEATHAA